MVDESVDFLYTGWEGNEKSEKGVNMFLTFTKENGQWKILSIKNQMNLPSVYKDLSKNYQGIGNPHLAYISHITQHIVSVLNTMSDSIIGIIPSGYGSCGIAFSKDRGYIANFNSNNVTVFNKKNNKLIVNVPAGIQPSFVFVTNDDKYVLITHQSNDGLWVMAAKDNQIVNRIPGVTGMPVYDPINNKIYISAIFTPVVIVMNPSDQSIIKRIDVGGRPLDIALTPDGKFLYLANFNLNEVEKIDTQTDSVVSRIAKVDSCRGIAVTPDGKYVYTTNVVSGYVTIIDCQNDRIHKTIYVGRMPTSITMDKYNNCAYVSNQGESSISVIDLKKQKVIKTIPVADNPIRIQIFPDNKK